MTIGTGANADKMIVPILSLHVDRQVVQTAGKNYSIIDTQLGNYFVSPEDSRGGRTSHKMSFNEAINRMTF